MAIKLTSEDWKRLRDKTDFREQLRQLSVKDKKYARDYLTKHRTSQELEDYYNNINDIYSIASNIRDYYKSTGNADYQAMSDYVTELDKVLGGRDTVTQMYGNFADQAAYDAYIKKVTENAERNEYLRNVDIDALSARLAWLGGKTNQFGTNNTDFLSNPNTMQSLMSDIKNGYTLPTTQAERDQEIAQLQKDIEEARYIQRIAAYESVVNNPDFNKEELLKSRAPSDYWAANPYHYLTDDQMAILNYWDSKEDPNFRDRYDSMAKNLAGLFGPTEGIIPSAPLSAADEYYDYLAPQLRQSVVDEFKTFGQENKHLGTGLSFLTNAGAMVTQPITFLTGDFNSFAAMTTGLREGATADMDAWNAFFYNLAVSGAESAAAAAIPMGLGTIPLAASAAAATQNDILLRGGTEGQAVIGGLLAGGAEAFFEAFSIGALADMVKSGSIKTFFKNFMGNLIKEVGTNASEELATELANIISDELIMGELSNYNTMVAEYMASGMSEEDAHKKAKQMIVHQLGEAAMSGALMGGGFTVLGGAVNTGANFVTGSAVTNNAKFYDKLNQAGATLSLDVDNEKTADARKLYAKIESYNEAQQNGKKAGPLKKAQNRVNVGRFANMLAYDADVNAALKKLNTGAKQNVSETVKTAEKVSKEANISKDNAEVTKSAMPQIVKAEGQELSQIYIEKDGNMVSLDKVAIEDADLAAAYSYAVTTGSVENANSFLKSYALSTTNASPTAFWSAWMGIAANGQTLKTTEENQAKVFAEYGDIIGDDAKLAAWLSGVTMKQTASERRIKAAEQARAEWEKDGKKVTKAKIDATELQNVELDAKQKEFVAFGRLFAEAFGINVKFVASKKGNRGDNGKYNRTTNTITLDVFAGIGNDANYNAVQSALANTLSHEVVHNMRIVTPEVYDTLSEYVFETLKAQGMDIDSRIQYYIDEAKREENKTMSREDAIEEIVAHACDGMLRTSETVREFMEGFYAKDKRAANRFTKAVKDVLKRLKDVFESLLGVKAYSAEAHLLYKAGADSVAEIQKIFDKGVLALREGNLARNYEIANKGNGENISEEMKPMTSEAATITADGTVMLQQRQYRETGRASVLGYLTEQYGEATAEDMISTMDKLYDVVDQIKDENPDLNIFSKWQETEVELDDEGHPIFTSNIKNGDYPLNQDFSRVCKKRRQLDEVLNWLASNKDFTVAYLTKNDYKKINDIIRDHGFEVACDLCFVDAKRFRQSEWAESFAETWNDLLKSVMVSGNATTFNFATDSMDISATDVVIDPSRQITYRKWSEGKVKETRSYKNLDDFLKNDRNANVKNMMKLIVQNEDMRHTFRAADVISSKGFDSIQRNAPQIRQILNGWGGSSAPKSSSLDSVYDNSILNISGYNQEAAYAVGGVRMNSFSDFIAHMFFDYCQAFADLDAKKLPMQAYSKELTFFLLFGRTGGKLNMSGIPEARTPSNGKYTKLEYEKQFAGLDIEPLLQYLGKPANKLTVEDCLEHLDMLDYLWAKESIDIKKATLLQSGIRFDKLSNDKIDKCYDLILEKKFDEAHSVAGRENVDLEYTKNVGIIAVGVSEPHIRKLLRDHTIRMVIPYHKSGLNPVIAKALHIHTYMDYTNTQSTKIQYKGEAARNLTKDDHIEPFSFYDYFGKTIDGVFYDAKATANRYIQWCQEMSTDKYTIIPKFNEFTNEENYYKLLEDFDCYNTITESHEAQNAVNFFGDTFPADYKSIITKELKAEQKTRDDFRTELDSTGMRQEILDVVRKRGFKGEADEMRQARANTVDGRIVAVVEDDILSGIYNGQWDKATAEKAKKAAKTALFKFKDGIAVKGITAKVNRDSRREYTRSNYSEALRNHDPDTYADKLRAASVADDVVIAATNWKRDGGLTKPRKDDFVDFDRGQTLIMSGTNKYSATVLVGITKQGDYVFYDVEDMSPTQFEIKNEGDLPTVTPDKPFDDILKVSNGNSISQSQQMSSGLDEISSDELSQKRISTPDPSTLLKDVIRNKVGAKEYGQYTESLKKYQDLDVRARNQEKRIAEIDAEISKLKSEHKQSGKGTQMDELYRKRKTAENKVSEYQKQMFALEARELSGIVRAETEKARLETQRAVSDKYQQQFEQYKQKSEQKVKELTAHYKQKSLERTENLSQKEYIEKIEKKATKLYDLLKNNSKDKHVPEIFQKVTLEFLEALDFSSKRYLNGGEKTKKEMALETKMKNLVDMLEGRASEVDLGEFFIAAGLNDDDAKAMVTNALREAYDAVYTITKQVGDQDGSLVLRQLSSEQLKSINNALGVLSHLISDVNNLVSNSRYKDIAALGAETVKDLERYRTYTKQGLGAQVDKFFNWTNALPFYAFKRMGKAASSIFEAFMDGFDVYVDKVYALLDFSEAALNEQDVKKWSKEIHHFKTSDGKDLYMSTADIMSFYCLDKRDQGQKHIRGGGIEVPVRKGVLVGEKVTKTFANDPKGVVITDELRARIISTLTSEQIEVAKKLQEYMSTVCAEWGNEISMKRFGVKQFNEKYYFPVQASENTLQKNDQVGSKERGIFQLLNASFTQAPNDNANNRIVVDNIFDVFATHSIEMAKYNAFALQLIDTRKWLNYKVKNDINGGSFETDELRAMLEKAFGKDAEKYIDTFLLDINGADKSGDRGLDIIRSAIANTKIAAVGLNLNVMLIQPTAYLRASAVISPKYLISNIKDTPHLRQAIKRGEKYSGIFRWKSLGYRGFNLAAPIADRIKHTESFRSKFNESVSMKGAELMDKLTWGALWLACENETAALNKSVTRGTEEFYQAVAKRFREVIYATQVVDSPLTKTEFMRSKGYGNAIFGSFMSEPSQSHNMFMDAANDIADTKRKGQQIGKQQLAKLARIGVSLAITEVVTATIRSFLDAARDVDDEDEEYWESYIKHFIENTLEGLFVPKIPIFNEIISVVIAAFTNGYSSSSLEMAAFEKLARAGKNIWNLVTGKNVSWTRLLKSVFDAVSSIVGLPISNLWRDMVTVYNVICAVTDNKDSMLK